MAGASLFALLDDIATLLDDVSILTKVAAKKTAGVLGDDLALNAQQVTGVNANRELPVVWAVAKGSLVNKVILVPAALAISALEAWLHSRGWNVPLIVPLMMIGGAFLCFEGVEKLAHRFLHSADEDAEHQAERRKALADAQVDMVAWEKDKVKGAIRTDFILSAEIIVLTLGVVATVAFTQQLLTLSVVAVAMTVFVYGLVAGTIAMFLVGGGILVHNVPALHHAVQGFGGEGQWGWLISAAANMVVGIVAGAIVLAAVTGIQKLRGKL